jgi:hypothetical protein
MSWLEALDFCERERTFQDSQRRTRLTASTTVVVYSDSNKDNRKDIDNV